MACEFLFFRILAWIIIEISTNKQDIKHPGFLPLIIKWKNTEFNLFLIFSAIAILKLPFFDILFGIFYIPSLLISIITVWIMRDIFTNEDLGEDS